MQLRGDAILLIFIDFPTQASSSVISAAPYQHSVWPHPNCHHSAHLSLEHAVPSFIFLNFILYHAISEVIPTIKQFLHNVDCVIAKFQNSRLVRRYFLNFLGL